MRYIIARSWRRSAVGILAGIVLLGGCGDDDQVSPPVGPSSTPTTATSATATITPRAPTATSTSVRTATEAPIATATSSPPPSDTPESTASPTGPSNATPTATATPTGSAPSFVGAYYGTVPEASAAVRFTVEPDATATGFLDFISGGSATIGGGGAEVVFSTPANGTASLTTGEYMLSGTNAGSPFDFAGQLPDPANPEAVGTLTLHLSGTDYTGTLVAGTPPPEPPTRTPTMAPGCDTADLAVTLSGVSGDFNGNATSFVVERMDTAIEQKAPDNIPGLNDTYNSLFNGSACTEERNIQVSIFGVIGGIAAGQSIPINNSGETPGAIVYYGQTVSNNDSVWSSSAGTVFIDSVEGSVVTMRVVAAAMTETAGAATGSFTLDVSGQVNNFTKE